MNSGAWWERRYREKLLSKDSINQVKKQDEKQAIPS
jgi:hypothetical protein